MHVVHVQSKPCVETDGNQSMIQGSKKVYLKGFNISLQFSYSYLECNSVFLYNFFSSNICEACTDVESVNKKPNILKKQD